MGKKYRQLIKTILISGMAFFVNYGINLVLVPFITASIGEEAYGFVSLSKEFATYAALITTAVNSFASRYIAVAYHKGNRKEANVYFSSVFFGDLAIGTVVLLAAIACIAFLEKLLNIPAGLITDVKILFLMIFLNFWVVTVFTAFSSAAFVVDKLDIVQLFKGISYVTEAAVLFFLYCFFPAKVFFVGIGLIAASLVVALSDRWITARYLDGIRVSPSDFSFQALKRLVFDGIWSSFSSLGKILNQGLDLIVCNLMLSSLAMSQIAIAKTIDSIVHAVHFYISQAFQPMFLKSYAKEDKTQFLGELQVAMKVSGMFGALVFAGFTALGLSYYRLWIPGQDVELIYRLTVITLATSIYVSVLTPLYYIYILTVKRAFPSIVIVLGGFLNVLGMYLLIRYTGMGVYAVVWTTTVIEGVISYVSNPLYMAHVLGVPWYTFYPGLLRSTAAAAAITVIFQGFALLYSPDSWLTLLLAIVIYGSIGVVLYILLVCSKKDRTFLLGLLRRKR